MSSDDEKKEFNVSAYKSDPTDVKAQTDGAIDQAIKTYGFVKRIFGEPVQNAIDSFVDPDSFDTYKPEEGCKVSVVFDLGNDTLIIRDNGRGISESDIGYITNVNTSKKKDSTHVKKIDYRRIMKGHAGIGIKATLYSSISFKIVTVRDGKKITLEINDANNYKNWTESEQHTATVEPTDEPNGTELTIKFPTVSDENSGDKVGPIHHLIKQMFNDWKNNLGLTPTKDTQYESFGYAEPVLIKKPSFHIIQWYIQAYTYAGCITRTLGDVKKCPDIELNVEVKLPDDKKTIQINNKQTLTSGEHNFTVGYWQPSAVLDKDAKHGAPKNTIKSARKKVTVPSDIKKIYEQNAQHGYYYELILPKKKVLQLLSVKNPSDETVQWVRDYVNGILVWISKSNYLRTDLRLPGNVNQGYVSHLLSANGVPTKVTVPFDPGVPAVHLVLDLDVKVTPSKDSHGGSVHHQTVKHKIDIGIKQFCKDLQKSLSPLISKVATIPPDDEKETKTDNTVFKAKPPDSENEKEALDELFNRVNHIYGENDVIQAFSSFCALNKINFKWSALDGHTVYDSSSDNAALVELAKLKNSEAKSATIEFKSPKSGTSMVIVTQQIAGDEQNLTGVDLIICWEDPLKNDVPSGYTVLSRDEDASGVKAGMYPDLSSSIDSHLVRVFSGKPGSIGKLKNSKEFAIILSLERIYDDYIEQLEIKEEE